MPVALKISISDVSLEGYEYDNVHSTTFAAFFNKLLTAFPFRPDTVHLS